MTEALADLDAAVVAAGGDEIDVEDDGDDDVDDEDGCDPILQLEASNRADTEVMTKLRALAQDCLPGRSLDSRGLLRISDKVYVPENPPTLAALLIRHVHEQPSTGHPGSNRMVCVLSVRFHLTNLAQRVAMYRRTAQCAVSWQGTTAHLRSFAPCQSLTLLDAISQLISSDHCPFLMDIT